MNSALSELRVGQIVATHGIRGEVRVQLWTDYPEKRFAKDHKLILRHRDLATTLTLTVESSRPHKNLYLVKFVDWNDINQALPWIKGELWISAEEAVPSSDDEFYYHEIIGCQVCTTEGKSVGMITEIIPNPANDLWVVKTEEGKKIYLPFIKQVVKSVRPREKRVVIEWMEGLD